MVMPCKGPLCPAVERTSLGTESGRRRSPSRRSSLSGGDYLLSEEGLGRHTPAVRAFKLMDRKIGASWMLLYNSEPYRLATSRAGVIHKKVKRHGGILCKLRGGSGHRTAELFAGSMKTSDHPAAIASDVFSSFLCLCRHRAICPLRAEVFKRSPMAPALSNNSLRNLAGRVFHCMISAAPRHRRTSSSSSASGAPTDRSCSVRTVC
jgi:hypothetical protein